MCVTVDEQFGLQQTASYLTNTDLPGRGPHMAGHRFPMITVGPKLFQESVISLSSVPAMPSSYEAVNLHEEATETYKKPFLL